MDEPRILTWPNCCFSVYGTDCCRHVEAPKLKTVPAETMSIYQSVRNHGYFDDEVTQPVVRRGAQQALRPAAAAGAALPKTAVDYTMMRRAKPAEYMLPMSIEWLKRLPENVRPMALARQYPRIANMLAVDWSRPRECRAYLADLLVDHRGNRKGFPPEVSRDLKALRDYYVKLHLELAD